MLGTGSPMPAIATICSSRLSASRGELAWIGGHRAFMTRIHRLKHIEGFIATALANDNAIRPHAQRVLHQVALANFAFAFGIGRPRFQPSDMQLLQLQFRCIFDRDQTLFVRDESERALSNVVLPVPVPPEMIREIRPRTAAFNKSAIAGRECIDLDQTIDVERALGRIFGSTPSGRRPQRGE